jgi:hypothetical protein
MARSTLAQNHRKSTYRSAWNTLNKAHTLLMSASDDPGAKKVADEVFVAMLKLNQLIERS